MLSSLETLKNDSDALWSQLLADVFFVSLMTILLLNLHVLERVNLVRVTIHKRSQECILILVHVFSLFGGPQVHLYPLWNFFLEVHGIIWSLYTCIYSPTSLINIQKNCVVNQLVLLFQIYIVYNKRTGKPRGYAFIEYEHERDMHCEYYYFYSLEPVNFYTL